jgi:MFS family permease
MNTLRRKIYLYRFLDDFMLIYPLYAVMFADRGLSAGQIASLFIAWSTTSILLEIPTGGLADKFSRRKLLALGQAVRALGYLCWLFIPNYWGFLAGFILWGVGGAFSSGTYEAFLFDELKAAGQEKDYVRVLGKAASFSLVGNLIATALASAAILMGYGFVLAASASVTLLSGLVAWSLPEAKRQESTGEEGSEYFATIIKGVRQALTRPQLLKVILFFAFIGTVYGALEEYDSLFAADAQLPQFAIPLALAVLGLVSAIASYIAHRFHKANRLVIIGLLFVSGISLTTAGSLLGVPAMILLTSFVFFIRLLYVVFEGRLQFSTDDATRATVTSVSYFLMEVGNIIFYVVYGFIAQNRSNVGAFQIVGVAVIAASIVGIVLLPKKLLRKKALTTKQ